MKIKLNIFSKLLLISLLISNAISQLTVYPDHYIETDSPYSSSTLYLTSDIKERQIYKLGYFTTSNSKIKSYKFGIIYSPDDYCINEYNASGINYGETQFFASIKSKTSTREKNFSEELELLRNYCTGNILTIKTPFPTLHNTGYILKYKLSMTNDNTADSNINIDLRIDSTEENKRICVFKMKGGVADWFKMTIKSKLSTTNKITMMFQCDGENDFQNFDVNTDETFKFILTETSGANIFISFYQVLLEDSSSSYVSSYNDNKIVRTYNGMEACDNTNEEKKCLIGYACSSSKTCKTCDSTCFECANEGQCSYCNVLTDVLGDGSGTSCKKNYIDFSNFDDFKIEVPLESNEFHERTTMGFWIFISDLSKARNGNSNIYHVVLKDRYVLSIIPNEISTGIYCHAYEDLYRTITSDTIYESHYTDRESSYVLYRMIPTEEQLKYINGKDLSGQWFHVSCGLSFDHKMFHVTTMINGEESSIERALRHENLYYDSSKNEYVENDIYNRHIINNDDQKLYLEFKNFGKAGSKVYLKYFLLFQEYIPPSYKFMYYDYYDANNINDFILVQSKFDELLESSNGYSFNYKIRNNAPEQKEIFVSSLKQIDLSPPKNFRLLKLLKHNYVYQNIECNPNQISVLTGDGLVNWDTNKPLFCQHYLDTKQNKCVSSGTCTNNGANYISYPSPLSNRYCDLICSGHMQCIDNYNENNFCIDGNENIYNLFYSCEDKQTKYYLQYSSFYSPEKIVIPISPPLESFIIEIWYYPDFFLSDSNRQGKFYYPETRKNFVFYSNAVHAYFLHSENKKLKVEDAASTYTSEHYHPYEWNKLVFYGKKVGTQLYKYFIINNLLNDYIRFKLTTPVALSEIRFAKYIEDENVNYNWATGYYRGLRIWDGSIATPELTVLYDNYYSSGANRIKSLKSAYDKLERKGYELTDQNLYDHVRDMVGYRIVCNFLSEVMDVVGIVESSKQLRIISRKDYITHPKETGYLSYHLIVEVPIYLSTGVEYIKAEIQIRTLAMNFWAALDHKIQYKFPSDEIPKEVADELLDISMKARELDNRMLKLNEIMNKYKV